MLRICISNFLYYAATACFYPYLQIMLRNNGFSHSLTGLILGASFIPMIFFPLILSHLADRSGKCRLLVIGCALASAILFFPLSSSSKFIICLLAVPICRGIHSSISPLIDSMSTIAYKGDSFKYSIIRGIGTGGYIASCLIVGFLGLVNTNSNASVRTMYLSLMAALIISLFFLPSMFDSGKNQSGKEKGNSKIALTKDQKKDIILFFTAIMLFKCGNSPTGLLSSYMTEVLHFGDRFIIFNSIGSIFEMAAMIICGKLLEKNKIRPYSLIMLGALALIFRLLIYRYFKSVAGFVIAQSLHGLSFGGFQIASIKYISNAVPKEKTSSAIGIYEGIGSALPGAIGNAIGGAVIQNFGYDSLFTSFAIITAASLLVFIAGRKRLESFSLCDEHKLDQQHVADCPTGN
ncbi:MAG: MFS transporter [Candidatus Cloacimonetes bacterium]|nr:MFS transporter [Candidatus Cloacimonadota bacterium]